MLTGNWKNFDELEESLTIAELEAMVKAKRDLDYENRKFMAALQGHKLPEPGDTAQNKFEEIKRRAEAKLAGKDEETFEMEEAGFGVIDL